MKPGAVALRRRSDAAITPVSGTGVTTDQRSDEDGQKIQQHKAHADDVGLIDDMAL